MARAACQWYDEQILQSEQEEKVLDDLKAEQLVYWIDADLNAASDLLDTYGYDSFGFNNLLVVEIRPERLKDFPPENRYRFAIDLGDRARRVYQFKRADLGNCCRYRPANR